MTSHVANGIVQVTTKKAQGEMRGFGAATRKAGTDVAVTDKKLKTMQGTMTRARASVNGLAGSMAGKLGLAGSAIGVAFALDQLADRAVEVSNVNKALQVNVDKAAAAVGHQTDKLSIAKEANRLYGNALGVNEDKLAKIFGLTAKLADASGEDLNSSLRAVTDALNKGNLAKLKKIGITEDTAEQERALAESLGKTTAELTLGDKQRAAYERFLEAATEKTEDLGDMTDTLGHKWVALKNQGKDLLDSLVTMDQQLKDLGNEFRALTGRDLEQAERARTRRWRAFFAVITLGISEVIRLNTTMKEASRLGPRILEAAEAAGAFNAQRGLSSEAEKKRMEQTDFDGELRQMRFEREQMEKRREEDSADAKKRNPGGRKKRRGGRGKKKEIAANTFGTARFSLTEDHSGDLAQAMILDQVLEENAQREEQRLQKLETARQQAANSERYWHEQKLAQIEAENKAYVEQQKLYERVTREFTDTMGGAVFAAIDAKEKKGVAFIEELADYSRSRGRILALEAAFQFAMAIVAAASLNPVKAAAHGTAGGIAAAKAAAFLGGAAIGDAIAGNTGSGGGGGRSSGGGGISGGAFRTEGRRGSSNGGDYADSDVPLSTTRQPAARANTRGGRPPDSVVINMHGIAATEAQVGAGVAKALRAHKQAGGLL